ncbi:uncharacterized protein ISCGN_022565 [Ixodes scapularis]
MPITESPTEVIAAAAEPMSPVPALSVSSTTTNDSVGLLWDSVSFPTCVSHEITMECEDTSSRASGVEEQSTRLLWDSMDFPMPVSLEMTRCEDVPSRAPGAGEHDSVEQCVHQRKVATLEGTIEQQKRHIVRLQESLAKERNGHEQRVQELLKENEQHKLRICHLEGRLAEGVKQTSEKTNVSFTVQLMSDVERLRFYTGFSSVERFQRFVEFVSDGYKVHKEDQTGKGRPPTFSVEDQLILVLSRLRLGLLEKDLAYRYQAISTVLLFEVAPQDRRMLFCMLNICVPLGLVLLPTYHLTDESSRWLITSWKFKDAERVIFWAARKNGLKVLFNVRSAYFRVKESAVSRDGFTAWPTIFHIVSSPLLRS